MADHIVTVSRLAANDLIRYYDVLPTRISIQHPVSPWVADWLANPAGEVRDEASPIRIGMFSDGNWHKSTDILPLLLRHFFSSHPEVPCQFLLAGNIRKEVLLRLQYDLSQLHLSDKLQYIGCVENPQSLFSRLNIFLLPSREESFSLAAQEAACMKVPIVGFEGVTGATDFIRQGAGILVPYLDLEKMSDSLSRLATDSKLRETVGQCGRQIVEDMYQRDSQMDVILSVIQRTIVPLTSL
jgi:glycosyltransferase involved in cell wall biosynthesis